MAGRFMDTPYGPVAADFSSAQLADLCVEDGGVQTGPFGSQLHQSDYVSDGTPIITVEHLGDNRIRHQDLPRVSDEDRSRLSRYSLQVGDIVFSRVGSVDLRALVREEESGWLFSGRLLRVRPRRNLVNPEYLSWFFGLPSFRDHMRKIAFGATMPSLNTKLLSELWIFFPPLSEQRAIAHILGMLDDKIELNRRMNATLEAMARALFKSWFVDFEPVRAKMEGRDTGLPDDIAALFPDRLVQSEVGEVPEGWEVRPLYDCADYINGLAFGNDDFSQDRAGLPVIKIGELKGGISSQTRFTEAILEPKYRILSGDILLSWSGSPDTSIDTFVWTGEDGWLNQHIFKVQFKRPEEKLFVHYLLRHLKPVFVEIARNKQTTGLGHVTAQDLKRLETVFPRDDILRPFNRLTEPLFQRAYSNGCESRTLAALRDALLPKLLSGEVRVNRAEQMTEAVS